MRHGLDFSGFRDLIGHVTIAFDTPGTIFYRCFIVTEWLSPTVSRYSALMHVHEHTNERTDKHDGSQYLLAEVIK